MLQLTANGQTLDSTNVSFNLTLRSSLSGSAGSYVYSFSIPYTSKNAQIFGWPYRLSRMNVQTASVDGELKFNGKAYIYGRWNAKSTNGKTIKLEMLIGAGEFNNLVEGLTLPDLFDVDMSVDDIIDHVNDQVTKTWPEVNHNFPTIYNPTFYGDPDDEDNPNPQWGGYINDFEGVFKETTENNNAVSPQLYLGYILKRIFDVNGYTPKGNVFTDVMLQSAIIYNNYALDNLVSTQFTGDISDEPIGTNTDYVIVWDENINDPGNHYSATSGEYTPTSIGNYRIEHTIRHKLEFPSTPNIEYYRVELYYGATMIDYHELPVHPDPLQEYTNNFNFEIVIDDLNLGDEFYTKIFYIDTSLGKHEARVIEADCMIINADSPENNEYLNYFNYKNHVPDKDVKEFLLQVYNSAKILPFFNHEKKEVDLLFLGNMLRSTDHQEISDGLYRDSLNVEMNTYTGFKFSFSFDGPDDLVSDNFVEVDADTVKAEVNKFADIPTMAVAGTIYFVKSCNCYYRRHYDEDTESFYWKAFVDKVSDYELGDDFSDELTTSLAPMLMRCEGNSSTGFRRNTPAISAPGTSNAFGLVNEFPLRIMFWVGLVGISDGIYPLATTIKYDTDFNEVLPMSWLPEEIAATYLPEFINWLQRRQAIDFTLDMLPAFLAAFDLSKKTKFENTYALFDEIYIKISNRSFGPGKFTGWSG